jgi:hypothetical protein
MLFSFCDHLASVVCCPLTFHILSSPLKSDNEMNPNLFNIWIIIINYGLECEIGKIHPRAYIFKSETRLAKFLTIENVSTGGIALSHIIDHY